MGRAQPHRTGSIKDCASPHCGFTGIIINFIRLKGLQQQQHKHKQSSPICIFFQHTAVHLLQQVGWHSYTCALPTSRCDWILWACIQCGMRWQLRCLLQPPLYQHLDADSLGLALAAIALQALCAPMLVPAEVAC